MPEPRTIAFLVAGEGIEQAELTGPWKAVQEAGDRPVLVSPSAGTVQAYHHLDPADSFDVDESVSTAEVSSYDGLVLPGGVANGDALRTDADSVSFVRDFVGSGKPVAAICHAIWSLVEADAVRDRTLTSWPSLQTDVRNAGGTWVDQEVVVDGNLVTSRKPDDIPAFNREFLALLDSADQPSYQTRTGFTTFPAAASATARSMSRKS